MNQNLKLNELKLNIELTRNRLNESKLKIKLIKIKY